MDEKPIDPEVVGREAPTRTWSFGNFAAPWLLLGAVGLGAIGVGAALTLSIGWFFALAWVSRWLWSHAFSPDMTRLVYGADVMSYGKALATTGLFVLVGWLLSPKKSS